MQILTYSLSFSNILTKLKTYIRERDLKIFLLCTKINLNKKIQFNLLKCVKTSTSKNIL